MSLSWLFLVYLLSLGGIAIFGLLGAVTLFFFFRHRRSIFPCPPFEIAELPQVTIQLPIYNEKYVVQRLIDSAVHLTYPRDRLQIQVIDDSDDDTTRLAGEIVSKYRMMGMEIEHLHRSHRSGFKAGALHEATTTATGEFIALFDADFVPKSDFLLKTIPHFMEDSSLGMVQARWGHLNPEESQLTAAQSIALDKHFAMEQVVRHRANMYPKFNGSGGIWRRKTLEDAGGWLADTVCEDLCLSTRAVLKGWRFRFLTDVVAPAELPRTISAYKNQQARWAKGSTQCLLKYGGAIMRDETNSLLARGYALLSMGGYTTHLLLLVLLIVQVPLIAFGYRPPAYLAALGVVGLSQPMLFVLGQKEIYPFWRRRLKYFPAMLLIAIGLAPVNTRAILQACFGRRHYFVRTPKGTPTRSPRDSNHQPARQAYTLPFDWIVLIELLLAAYAFIGLLLSLHRGNFGPVLFLFSCTLGLGFVAIKGMRETIAVSRNTLH